MAASSGACPSGLVFAGLSSAWYSFLSSSRAIWNSQSKPSGWSNGTSAPESSGSTTQPAQPTSSEPSYSSVGARVWSHSNPTFTGYTSSSSLEAQEASPAAGSEG